MSEAKIERVEVRILAVDPDWSSPSRERYDSDEAFNEATIEWVGWRERLGDKESYFADIQIFDAENHGMSVSLSSPWLPKDYALRELANGIAKQIESLLKHVDARFPVTDAVKESDEKLS